MRRNYFALALTALLAATTGAFGQAPDCTGISPVLNSDPDLIGELDTVRIASGLQFPVFVTAAPGDMDRLFVLEKPGRIRVINDGELLVTPFLDIDNKVNGGTSEFNERGLLGLGRRYDEAQQHEGCSDFRFWILDFGLGVCRGQPRILNPVSNNRLPPYSHTPTLPYIGQVKQFLHGLVSW